MAGLQLLVLCGATGKVIFGMVKKADQVKVYHFDGGGPPSSKWTQLGWVINGDMIGDRFGASLDLPCNGRLAIRALWALE